MSGFNELHTWHAALDVLHDACLTPPAPALPCAAGRNCADIEIKPAGGGVTPTTCAGSPANPANGIYSCGTSSSPGRVCTATCNTGFTGLPSATCLSTGLWSATTGACQQQSTTITCKNSPANPTNGVFNCGTSSSVGRVCTAACNSGFTGAPSATCLSNGAWSGVTGQCSSSSTGGGDSCPAPTVSPQQRANCFCSGKALGRYQDVTYSCAGASGATVQGLSTSSALAACAMTPSLVSATGLPQSLHAVHPSSAVLPHASLAAQALSMLLLCLCQLSRMARLLPLQLQWSLLLLWLLLIPLLLLSLLRRQQWHLLLRLLWKLVLLLLLMQLLLLLQSLLLPQHQWPLHPLGKQ